MKNILSLSDAITIFRNLAGDGFLGCFLKGHSVFLLQLHCLCAQKSQPKLLLDSIMQAALRESALKTAPDHLRVAKALPGDLAVFGLDFGEMNGRKTQCMGHEIETSLGRDEEVSIMVSCIREQSKRWQHGAWLHLRYWAGAWVRSSPYNPRYSI